MQVKTSELSGVALDWAVAKCEHDELAMVAIQYPKQSTYLPRVSPSTNWQQGGPIIERERIGVYPSESRVGQWVARQLDTVYVYGDTPLMAAMRCYVVSELGDSVDIPEELI